MARSKEEKALEPKDAENKFRVLTSDVAGNIPTHSSVTDVLNLIYSSITTHNLFKPHLEPLKAKACVVQGDLATLILIAQRNPAALFQKGNITDPRERTFYNVSAWQLILFLCDVDMKNQLMPFIPEQFKAIAQKQTNELGSGGADLIKLSRDPQAVAFEDFDGLTQFKQTLPLIDGTRKEVTFPLLENVDGIVYFQDKNKEVHFYYANRESKTITSLVPDLKSEEDKQLFAAFKASFDAMENNSSRRSSDTEHQLIAKLFNAKPQRQGIQYEHQGIRYQDSRTSFSLINAYRTSIRLYDEVQNYQYEKADTYWREVVGKAQGEEMWLLERICEEGRPFHPLPADFKEFKRGFTFYNWITNKVESAFAGGKLAVGLGSDFALYKGRLGGGRGWAAAGWDGGRGWDLIAV
ncbi:TPA: lpg1692 family Dot/Icm T4SS effector, partial [Legionella pneumophila]